MADLVWIRLYSLPQEFWDKEMLNGIENTLGSFVKILEVKKVGQYASYTWICVYMNIARVLLDLITISCQDTYWTQTLYYDHIPFQWKKCHKHGHLFRYFPLNAESSTNRLKEQNDEEGFTKIPSKRKTWDNKKATTRLIGPRKMNGRKRGKLEARGDGKLGRNKSTNF
jgi:hypothetical protein